MASLEAFSWVERPQSRSGLLAGPFLRPVNSCLSLVRTLFCPCCFASNDANRDQFEIFGVFKTFRLAIPLYLQAFVASEAPGCGMKGACRRSRRRLPAVLAAPVSVAKAPVYGIAGRPMSPAAWLSADFQRVIVRVACRSAPHPGFGRLSGRMLSARPHRGACLRGWAASCEWFKTLVFL